MLFCFIQLTVINKIKIILSTIIIHIGFSEKLLSFDEVRTIFSDYSFILFYLSLV